MKSFGSTVFACYVGYVVQAIVINFLPLLYVRLSGEFGITTDKVTVLITVTFALQLTIDALAAGFVDKIGYRRCMVAAHVFAGCGLVLLGVLPYLMKSAYAGVFLSMLVYSTGSGLIEVLISPIVEACPTKNKSAHMSLLHSFYCWGLVVTVLLSTLFFAVFGIDKWRYMAFFWSIVPFVNAVLFSFCPINTVSEEGNTVPLNKLFSNKRVWAILVLMACAGAAEVGVAQWASDFAERGLGVSKTYGDLLGPCLFAVCMGSARVLYPLFSGRIELKKALMLSGALCVLSYLLLALSPRPWLSLVGSALVGLSVGILWPGFVSLGAAQIKEGGTSLFALMALAGDLGCITGPALVGFIGGAASFKTGFLFGAIFPVILVITLAAFKIKRKDNA